MRKGLRSDNQRRIPFRLMRNKFVSYLRENDDVRFRRQDVSNCPLGTYIRSASGMKVQVSADFIEFFHPGSDGDVTSIEAPKWVYQFVEAMDCRIEPGDSNQYWITGKQALSLLRASK